LQVLLLITYCNICRYSLTHICTAMYAKYASKFDLLLCLIILYLFLIYDKNEAEFWFTNSSRVYHSRFQILKEGIFEIFRENDFEWFYETRTIMHTF
jgi:hypothetical protein